jgi:hypothetical protein
MLVPSARVGYGAGRAVPGAKPEWPRRVALNRYLADGLIADVRPVAVDDGGPENRSAGCRHEWSSDWEIG